MNFPPPITSRSNAKVKALRAALSGKASRPGETAAVEGDTILEEALRSGLRPQAIFLRQGSEAIIQRSGLRALREAPLIVVSAEAFDSALDTESPQGIAALIEIPELSAESSPEHRGQPVLVLEGIQDPGNLGTLLRTAEAFGATRLIVTPETVNPWNPKAIRASAGSVFRVPVQRMTLTEIQRWSSKRGISLYAAVAQSDGAVDCMDADLARPCALMIGNEGAGLSSAAVSIADARIHIPCATESLNAAAAGATLLYEAMRQRRSRGVTEGTLR
jgi:TrmH family RNA methyltransferase